MFFRQFKARSNKFIFWNTNGHNFPDNGVSKEAGTSWDYHFDSNKTHFKLEIHME